MKKEISLEETEELKTWQSAAGDEGGTNSTHRYIILILICFSGLGKMFCADGPSAAHDHFKADLNMTNATFTMLFSVLGWSSVVMSFVGGFLTDRVFGLKLGIFLYGFVMSIGQLVFALGGTINSLWTMLLGRFIFGIGSESINVTQSKYIARCFKNKELNMAFSLSVSFNRAESTMCFLLMEPLYQEAKKYFQGSSVIGAVLFTSSLACAIALLSSVTLRVLDKHDDGIPSKDEKSQQKTDGSSNSFDGVFWMVCVVCVSYYVSISPFTALGKGFFQEKFQYSPEEANRLNSMIYLLSAFLCPLFGAIVDKTGRNLNWLFLSTVISILSHGMLAFSTWNPYIAVCILSVAYSAWTSSFWPLIALIVPEHKLGVAYGICYSILNLGLAVVSMFTGLIVDHYGYVALELFFISWLSLGLLATAATKFRKTKSSVYLNMSPNKRKIFDSSVS